MNQVILVEAWRDNMGNILARPVSDKWARQFANHVKEFTGNYDERAFLQGGAAEEFMEDCTPAQRRDLEHGYTIRFKMSAWNVGHWYGYDAHTLAE